METSESLLKTFLILAGLQPGEEIVISWVTVSTV
jgi:hypothetical protein